MDRSNNCPPNRTIHSTACRAEAARCRLKAAVVVERTAYWLAEAEKWEKRAEEVRETKGNARGGS